MSDLVTKRGRPRKTPKQEPIAVLEDEPIDIPMLESEPEPEVKPEVKTEKPVKPKKPAKQVKPKTPIKKENDSSVSVFKNPLTGKSEWVVNLRRPDCDEKMRITVEFQT